MRRLHKDNERRIERLDEYSKKRTEKEWGGTY